MQNTCVHVCVSQRVSKQAQKQAHRQEQDQRHESMLIGLDEFDMISPGATFRFGFCLSFMKSCLRLADEEEEEEEAASRSRR